MPMVPFRKKLIVSAIASGSALAFHGQAGAQDAVGEVAGGTPGPVLEEVVVTGIRGSLQRSMDVKRDAQGVVDAISAEDIGKMPDTNLA